MNLLHRVAVITGSSSGIGRSIALAMADAGADIVLHGRDSREALEETVADIQSKGRRATYFLADLRDLHAIDDFAESAWSAFAGADIWVNNAGADVLTGDSRGESFAQKLEVLWRTDVRASLLLARNIGQRMRSLARQRNASPGDMSILNLGWDQAFQGMEGESGELFATVKGAVMSATLSLAQSLAPEVRVNCLAPGWIRTAWGQSASEAWQVRATRESLLGRWGAPDDVAQVAVFLSSPQANFINGQIIPINGGFRFNQSAL